MQTGKRIITFALTLILSFSLVLNVGATDLGSEEKKAKEIEEKKKNAEAEQTTLTANLNTILNEMQEIRDSIAKKLIEIADKEVELTLAQTQADEQYEAMKLRIKFMYESGDTQFLEVLVESENFADLINNVEYIQNVSAYDRDMLVSFQEIVTKVKEQEKALKDEHTKLEDMQTSLQTKQSEVETLLAMKSQEVSTLTSELSKQNQKIAEMKKAAEEAARIAAERSSMSTPVYGSGGGALISGNGQFAHPNPIGRVTSPFGYRTNPIYGGQEFHKGIDYASATGTPIYAAEAGTVTTSGYGPSTGNWIVINHGGGLLTYYMHCSALYVRVGEQVSKGQNIAAVGSTGDSTGPHVHFQVMENGTAVNPLKYL